MLVQRYEERGICMLSDRLKDARKQRGYTQDQLAKKVLTTKATISNYENGYSTPNNNMLVELSTVLGVSTDYLLGKEDYKLTSITAGDMVKEAASLGIDIGFYNEDDLKKLSPEDVEELRRHFEWIVEKSKQRDKWED